ncbi:uncharacterized protein K02A2.6-like, partial [Ahaetulla prasina]|uniref:uncharacterized protein K02A2.6-like n=1 Tax=Ahaetulla prasina TaxID=499056 RepID=UPI0026474350
NLPSLLGLDWFRVLGMGITGVHSVGDNQKDELLREFEDIFQDSLGKYVGTPISFNLDPQIAPIRLKARRVPFALKPKIDRELDKLVNQGILVPVDHAKWETPIVTPVKPDGSVHICADYKATLNKALQKSVYPVPIVQHLFALLPVDNETAEAQTIVTHRGVFKCARLQFGVSVAPGLFQNLMEQLLQGLPGVVPYFDDVLISSTDWGELRVKLWKRGWPMTPGERFKQFTKKHSELSVQGGCLLWGDRVVIPEKLRGHVLELLHVGHPGIVRMKSLARRYVWWSQMDKDISDRVGKCQACQESRPLPPTAPIREWEKPQGPWSRIHIDFAGPFHGQTFLIVVDAYSKWLEIILMKTTTAEAVITVLRRLFVTHGLPDTIVSDNGPQFTATQFEGYLAREGIRHALSAPFHPAMNGLAERFVRSA